jgi:hypothetical protein
VSLRVRLLGTIIGAIVLFFLVSVIASRIELNKQLRALGTTQVTNGSGAFSGYWDSRKDGIKLLVAQDAVSDALRKNLQSHNAAALNDQLASTMRTSGLSFLTVVDTNGNVIARANGPQRGSLKDNKIVARALTGETVSTATLLDQAFLTPETLGPQAQSEVKGADGKTVVEKLDKGIAIVAAVPISDENERTIGAIYGGVLLNHNYDLVDQTTHALGGASALLDGDAIVSSTISSSVDQTRTVDQQVANAADVLKSGNAFDGTDTQGGTEYLVHIDPIIDDQRTVIGARWYGTPLSEINDIINHTTQTLVIWGVIAALLALALAIPIVGRLSSTLAQQSQKVRTAAKELGVVMVGAEVSGDHIAMTKAAVDKSSVIIADLQKSSPSPKIDELKSLSDELQGDMIVIDTLSQEMSGRMTQAVDRVKELNGVAAGLNELVTGEAG